MRIFNRWGETIFTSEDSKERWNGLYNGDLCQEGVYVCLIEYSNSETKSAKKVSAITLLR
jgi:gliding motility-associated-like protein